MGLVVVISLPLILFCILLGLGCYFLGRARGRQDVKTNPQVFGVPTPPPAALSSPDHLYHTKTNHKPDCSDNV